MRVEVWDDDGNNIWGIGREDDLVDKYIQNVKITPTKDDITPVSKRIYGRRSSLRLLVR